MSIDNLLGLATLLVFVGLFLLVGAFLLWRHANKLRDSMRYQIDLINAQRKVLVGLPQARLL